MLQVASYFWNDALVLQAEIGFSKERFLFPTSKAKHWA
jgi:hypothetical protein